MDQNILLSKIVANPTDNTWSQAYSTLNLYIVLSINKSGASEESIVTQGKELLEKIQREYFSLDEKNLTNIKKSIDNSVQGIDKESISITLTTIQEDTLYIVIAEQGEVVLKRSGKIGIVARGEINEISAFSGKIQSDDIIILETGDFSKKIPLEKLSSAINTLDVSELSENLAPQVHENSIGTEAAIILQYKNMKSAVQEEQAQEPPATQDDSIEELGHEEKSRPKINIPALKIPSINFNIQSLSRKKLIIISIVALIIIFAGSIFFEKTRQVANKRNEALSEILIPAQKKYDEAIALESLNKGLAYEEFDSLKTTLEESRSKFAQNTPERKKLDEFIGKVESKIGELGTGSAISNQKTLFENVDFVTSRDGLVSVDSKGKIYLLSNAGSKEKGFDSKNGNVKSVTADDKSIYILGDKGITRTNKSTGSTATIVSDPKSAVAIDIFGNNIYALNATDKTIDKYVGEKRSDYFAEDIKLSDPISISIDASIWVLDGKKIRKFTRGREDSFSIQGLTGDIGDDSKIFTAPDFSSIYILDPKSARIVSIKKDGEFDNQYSWKDLAKATSFSVDEDGETVYVIINNKLYSFDL